MDKFLGCWLFVLNGGRNLEQKYFSSVRVNENVYLSRPGLVFSAFVKRQEVGYLSCDKGHYLQKPFFFESASHMQE